MYFRSFRLQSRRPLKKLMMNTAGCDQRSSGIGDIAYVKDLLTGKIVTAKLRCSKFDVEPRLGWVRKSDYINLSLQPQNIVLTAKQCVLITRYCYHYVQPYKFGKIIKI